MKQKNMKKYTCAHLCANRIALKKHLRKYNSMQTCTYAIRMLNAGLKRTNYIYNHHTPPHNPSSQNSNPCIFFPHPPHPS